MTEPESVGEFMDQVKRVQDEGSELFCELQAVVVKYVSTHKPAQTSVALALIDLLAVWGRAMEAPRNDIVNALNMNWDRIGEHPQRHVDALKGMNKHVN